MTTLYDSLESILVFLRDTPHSKNNVSTPQLFNKLSNFKFIYILYFVADMLHMLSKLSKIFQSKVVDISSIGSIIKTKITFIRMCFLVDSCDLNQDTFNPGTDFHVIPEFGPPGGYLQRLPTEIQGSKFHSIQMTRDPSGADLEVALSF